MGRDGVSLKPEAYRLLFSKKLLLVDLECTCGLGVPNEKEVQEIIELGLCMDGAGAPAVHGRQQSIYIRPLNTWINEFCEKLTGISERTVDGSPFFPARMDWLASAIEEWGPERWASWGEFDRAQIQRQCDREGVRNPLGGLEHVNAMLHLKTVLTAMSQERGLVFPNGARRGVGIETALKLTGLEFEGRQHCGADDAFNMGRVIQMVREWVGDGGDLLREGIRQRKRFVRSNGE